MALDPQIRTRIRIRSRRRSACHRHPNETVNGFCALCLRDRLATLDASSGQPEPENAVASFSSCSRRTRGHGIGPSVPELRRSKSVVAVKCQVSNGLGSDARRKSCDVRARNTLSDMFVIDDTNGGGDGVVRVESKNLGFSSVVETVLETRGQYVDDNDDEIRVSDELFVRNEVDDDGEIGEEQDLKTMKEHIDIELQNKKKNFWEAASVFSQKLRKWRQKQKEKKPIGYSDGGTDNGSKLGQFEEAADHGIGRRSCDTEPRFSVDVNRISMEDPRLSFDERRASWDGYMIARTIPRLTPMLPIVDDMMLASVNNGVPIENQQMHPINEEVTSAGGSAQSSSDSSSSNRGSNSSSMKSSRTRTAGLEGDDMKYVSEATKLVITERELKDWHLSSINNNPDFVPNVSNPPISTNSTIDVSNGYKRAMTSRWRKVCKLWGHTNKLGEKKNGNQAFLNQENGIDGVESGNSSAKLIRNGSVSSRNRAESHQSGGQGAKNSGDEFVLDRNRSTRYSTSDLGSGLLRFYPSQFRNSRSNVH